jgi:hypothetical protein
VAYYGNFYAELYKFEILEESLNNIQNLIEEIYFKAVREKNMNKLRIACRLCGNTKL